MKKLSFLLILLTLGISSVAASAQKKPSADTPVTSTIRDADANFAPYSIQSDMLGTYQNGTSSVVSIIQSIGDWELSMLSSASRRVSFSFNESVPNTNPNNLSPPANGFYPTRFLAQCSARGGKLQSLALNASLNCPLIGGFDVGTTRFRVVFNAVNFSGTNDVQWICTSALNGKCTGWRAASGANGAASKLVAKLQKVVSARNKITYEDYGNYYFSFEFSLTNP